MASVGELPNEEYEAQFLGFTPSLFLSGVEKAMAERLSWALDKLEQHLQEVPENILSSTETSTGMATLRQETDKHFSKTINKFKSNVHKVLEVPPEVLHPVDKEQAHPATASDIALSQAEIDKLHLLLKNEKFMIAKYREEIEEIDTVLKEQDRMLSTTLSPTVMASIDTAKDELEFIKANQSEIGAAEERAHSMSGSLPNLNNHKPADCLIQDVFHINNLK